MRSWLRRSVGYLAIVAIAAHTILMSLAPLASAAAFDPFNVICHSQPVGAAPADRPSLPQGTPAKACDHCTLCSAVPSPAAPTTTLAGQLAPAGLIAVLYPQSTAPAGGIAATPNLARGPPQQA